MLNSDNVEKIDLDKIDWRSSREFFESLGEELDKLDNKDESYNFTWVGKRKSIVEAGSPINKTLRPDLDASKDFDNTKNMLIVGDNLDALKLFQESYLGKIKMIYIDPPYNTGHDFIYHDSFTIKNGDYKDNTTDSEGNKIISEDEFTENSKANGRFHSDWLSMMYPRLKLARNLLTEDGAIFISIDDNEQDNLKKICNEVFGEDNFIACLIWSAGRKNQAKYISVSHEYVLCYVKSQSYLANNNITWREKKRGLDDIYSKYNKLKTEYGDNFKTIEKELKQWYKTLPDGHPAKDHSYYDNVDANGIYFKDNISAPGGNGAKYDLVNPATGVKATTPSRGWITNESTMKTWVKEGKVDFGNPGSVPTAKAYLKDRELSVPYSVFYNDGRGATKRLASLIGNKVFDFPKDENILNRFINFCGVGDNDLVLDFFAGSGTTGHAVMDLNAEDGGNRKYILVQLDEPTDEKSEARKTGYKTIDQITAERLRRAGDKIIKEHPDLEGKLDTGFRVFRIDSENENTNIRKPLKDVSQTDLFNSIDNIKKDRTPLDLLFGVVYASALPFDLKLETKKIDGNTVYLYGYLDEDSGLVACFDDNISEDTIKEIAKLKPLTAAFKDSSFQDSAAKINLSEQFRVIAPDTKVKVI